MKTITEFWGETRFWWALLLCGILLIIGGFAYWFWPAAGYAVASQLFGWLLIATGIVQLCVSAGENRPRGWGWWLAGGTLDIFLGFIMVRNIILSEEILPFFLAAFFLFWGIGALCSVNSSRRLWWLRLVNGILMLVISYFFFEGGYVQDMLMVSMLTALAFIYWGFSLAMLSYDLRPTKQGQTNN